MRIHVSEDYRRYYYQLLTRLQYVGPQYELRAGLWSSGMRGHGVHGVWERPRDSGDQCWDLRARRRHRATEQGTGTEPTGPARGAAGRECASFDADEHAGRDLADRRSARPAARGGAGLRLPAAPARPGDPAR